MRYNEQAILAFNYNGYQGEEAVNHYLIDNPNSLPPYDDYTENNMKTIDAIENYIIKCINEGTDGRYTANYINLIYNGFMINPSLYIKSKLINNYILENKIEKRRKKEIKEKEIQITKSIPNLFEKRMNNQATEAEKELLSNYFIKTLHEKNPILITNREKYAKKLIEENKPIKNMNNSELTFLAYWIERTMDPDGKLVDQIRVCDRRNRYNGGSYNNRSIHINQTGDYLTTIDNFISTVYHETRHAIQDKESKTKKSLIGFQFAADEILKKYLTTSTYSPYKSCDNYRYSEIETDANLTGYIQARELLFKLGFKERSEVMLTKNVMYKEERQLEFANKLGSDGIFNTPENVLIKDLSLVVKDHPHLLNIYPSLQDFYNKDGSPKNFREVLLESIKVSLGNKTFQYYKDFLRYALTEEKFEEIDIDTMDDKTRARYYITLIKLFYSETRAIKEHLYAIREINSEKRKKVVGDNDIYGTGYYNMKRYRLLMHMICKNYDDIVRLEKLNLITMSIWGTPGINSCIRDISDLNIENDVLMPRYRLILETVISESRQKRKEIIEKRKKNKIQKLLSEYDEQTLSTMVPLPNGNKIPLRQYIEENIQSEIDTEGVFLGNERYSAKDEIDRLIEETKRTQNPSSKFIPKTDKKSDIEIQIGIIKNMDGLTDEQKQLLINQIEENEKKPKPRHMRK